MSYFDRKEFSNFVKYSIKHPVAGLADFTEFGIFILRNIANKLSFKFISDKHKARKKRPCWLNQYKLISQDENIHGLFFPQIAFNERWNEITIHPDENIQLDPNDPEAYFKENRWSICNYYLTPGVKGAEKIVEEINQWISDSPAFAQSAWETYSVAERVANSIIFLSVDAQRQQWLDTDKYRSFLLISMEWITDHLEYYGPSKTNNHYINDARALIMGGSVLNHTRYIDIGLKIICSFGLTLFSANGYMRERSTHYQVVTANWLMDADLLLKTIPIEIIIPDEWDKLIDKVYDATLNQIQWFGWNTLIGDISPDISPKASAYRFMKLYGNRNRCQATSLKLENTDCWFYVAKENSVVIGSSYNGLLTCPFPTHRHNDVTGFVWRYKGVPILIDAGRLNYTKNEKAVKQVSFRGHNILALNDVGPMPESIIINGDYLPVKYANAKVRTQTITDVKVTIKHNGFSRFLPSVEHTRTITVNPDGIEVSDAITGTGKLAASVYFHFDQGFELTANSNEMTACNAVSRIAVNAKLDNAQPLIFQKAFFDLSTEYGISTTAPEIIISGEITLPCIISTTFKVLSCAG